MINPKTISECIGTAVLVFIVQVASSTSPDAAAFAIGAILVAIIFAIGPVSGGHVNPSVSFAVYLRGAMPYGDMITYMIAHLLGGTLGGLLGGVVASSFSSADVGDDHTLLQALLAEMAVTFVLCFVVLGVACNPKAEDNHYFGLAIGLVVMSGAIAVGPISGGCFNPAVALCLCISSGFTNPVYAVMIVGAQLLGGAIAAGCSRLTMVEDTGSADENIPLNRSLA